MNPTAGTVASPTTFLYSFIGDALDHFQEDPQGDVGHEESEKNHRSRRELGQCLAEADNIAL